MDFKKTFLLVVLFSSGFSATAQADVVVIVNPSNQSELNAKAIRSIFLGKTKSYPNGNKVEAFDLPANLAVPDAILPASSRLNPVELTFNSNGIRFSFAAGISPSWYLYKIAQPEKNKGSNMRLVSFFN